MPSIPVSTNKNFLDSGIRITLHGAKKERIIIPFRDSLVYWRSSCAISSRSFEFSALLDKSWKEIKKKKKSHRSFYICICCWKIHTQSLGHNCSHYSTDIWSYSWEVCPCIGHYCTYHFENSGHYRCTLPRHCLTKYLHFYWFHISENRILNPTAWWDSQEEEMASLLSSQIY